MIIGRKISSLPKHGESTVLWWIGWIVLTIVSFFISCYFWTGYIAKHVGGMDKPGAPVLWVATVFGSWMALLVPLIIVMYNKVDKAYEDARIARETAKSARPKNEFGVKSVWINPAKRLLSKELSARLSAFPEAVRRGHLVTAVLRDGRKIENVFILNKAEIMGIYAVSEFSFSSEDVIDLVPADLDKLPLFDASKWLRLDGVGS